MGAFVDITGQKYWMLTAMKPTANRSLCGGVIWVFRCECGNEKAADACQVKHGLIKSCGCLSRPHGLTGTRLFNIWVDMRQRCSNPNSTRYKNWGGKGVRVCQEWENSFLAFNEWSLKSGYADSLSIDRIDNNGNYCPENCRWATHKQQARNSSNARIITAGGQTRQLVEWAEITGMSGNKIAQRIDRYGYTPEQALGMVAHGA